MVEFYFWFWFSRLRHYQHVILHLLTNFIRDRVMASYPRWRPQRRNSTFVFRDFDNLERSNSTADQISARNLNRRLRYYYVRFIKTDVRHVGILLPLLSFTFASLSACHFAPVYQISSKSDHRRQSNDVISIFQDGRCQPYWNATASKFYFRSQFSWVRSFGKVEIYRHTKFRRDHRQHGSADLL